MRVLCLKCKGRGHCGRSSCAVYTKTMSWMKYSNAFQKEGFEGASPSLFVGRQGYPSVNVGILARPDGMAGSASGEELDSPRAWASGNMGIPDIVDYRSTLINSRFRHDARSSSRLLDVCRDVSMASKPVDVEVRLKEKPSFRLNTDPYIAPTGPNALLDRAEATSNPRVDRRVYSAVDDNYLKSSSALSSLYSRGFEESFLSKLLSSGTLGLKSERRLVPTRWSITAVDDTLGKRLIDEIRDYSESDIAAYFGGYLGNYYLALMFPGVWSYELFEVYMPNSSWNTSSGTDYTTDYEPYSGRKSYAENCAGGYYAARLPVLKALSGLRRQAGVLLIRVITGEYTLPLGVWVCREATRKALGSRPLEFSSEELMLRYAKSLMSKKFGLDISEMLSKSRLLRERRTQARLSAYFSINEEE